MNFKAALFSLLIASSVTVDTFSKGMTPKRSEDEQRPFAYIATREAIKMAVILPLLVKYLEVTNAYIKQNYPDDKSARGAIAANFQKLVAGTLLYATFEDALKATRQYLNGKVDETIDTVVATTVGV